MDQKISQPVSLTIQKSSLIEIPVTKNVVKTTVQPEEPTKVLPNKVPEPEVSKKPIQTQVPTPTPTPTPIPIPQITSVEVSAPFPKNAPACEPIRLLPPVETIAYPTPNIQPIPIPVESIPLVQKALPIPQESPKKSVVLLKKRSEVPLDPIVDNTFPTKKISLSLPKETIEKDAKKQKTSTFQKIDIQSRKESTKGFYASIAKADDEIVSSDLSDFQSQPPQRYYFY